MPAKPQCLTFLFHGIFISLIWRQKAKLLSYAAFCAAVLGNSILVLVWCDDDDWGCCILNSDSICFVWFSGRWGGVYSPPPCRNEAVLIFICTWVEDGRKLKFVAVFFKCDGERRTGAWNLCAWWHEKNNLSVVERRRNNLFLFSIVPVCLLVFLLSLERTAAHNQVCPQLISANRGSQQGCIIPL